MGEGVSDEGVGSARRGELKCCQNGSGGYRRMQMPLARGREFGFAAPQPEGVGGVGGAVPFQCSRGAGVGTKHQHMFCLYHSPISCPSPAHNLHATHP